mgnify:CR=1 FL=1
MAIAACAPHNETAQREFRESVAVERSDSTVVPPTVGTSASSTSTEAPATTRDAPGSSSTSTEAPATIAELEVDGVGYRAAVTTIDDTIASRMSKSWRPGCPVGLEDLRLLTVAHWDFSGDSTTGELVVHADHAEALGDVFGILYDAGFPIERMELVDVYDADDDRSMAANNTSAFNCREVAWKPGVWSNHAYGTALDLNPLVNPYVSGSTVLPPEGLAFADRSARTTGGVYPGDVVVNAFTSIGWGWGGDWSSAKDWQHFSASGR